MSDRSATERIAANSAGVAKAAGLLRNGNLVAFPTETVYGLGADATDDRAVARVFEAKGRPSFNPLIAHVESLAAAKAICTFAPDADRLAQVFWPGALTLVLPMKGAPVSRLVTAGGPFLAVRVPGNDMARDLIAAVGRPVAGPSANPSGRLSPTSADHVLAGLDGRIAAVLDAGPCPVGIESTIVGFEGGPHLLRAGGIPVEALEHCLGRALDAAPATGPPVAPGQLASHYAPTAAVRLNAQEAEEGEVLIGFAAVAGDFNLSPGGDLTEAAANLFDVLHRADDDGRQIAVAPIPEIGLGRAINDRLRRAAAPRDYVSSGL
ncbi:MAG: L-threonylcarbamoyladenylate synthase [Pseudomonadota bacterium]